MTVMVESWEDCGADPEAVAWFAQYEPLLMMFAEQNNLAIAKYLKDTPSWHFVFAHPRGGQGRVDVTRTGDDGISVSAVWHKDDYDAGARSAKFWSSKEVIPPEKLREELSAMLRRVLAWRGGDYEVTSGFKEMWQKYLTRDQVEHIKYPMPNMTNAND